MSRPTSRFDDVSRRTFLRRSLATSAVVLVPVLAACAQSDEEVFAEDDGTAGTTAASGSVGSGDSVAATSVAATSGDPATVGTGTDATSAAESTMAGAASSGVTLPETAELTVDFTFTADGSGRRVNNPYIAVWIEDAAEELVQTVALWFNPPKGFRWLPDLKRWYSADQARIAAGGDDVAETISSATRVAGSYSVVWDGTDLDGNRVAQGEYHVCIEGAREHGPYELIRQAVTFGTEGFSTELTPDGELTAASVTFRV